MNANKGLKLLSETLQWNGDQATAEFAWLRMMAAIKYDDYRDFLPGMRFLEHLAAWLQQFKTLDERRLAYDLLRRRLIYVSPPEMQRLVELFYPMFIERHLIKLVSERRKIPRYMVRVDQAARDELARLRRRTLILGLSEGARIDILRHSTTGILSNEQFVLQTQIDQHKWQSLVDDLQEQQPDKSALFEVVYLVDDFMGTGSSFLRFDRDKQKWKGKLYRFLESLETAKKGGVTALADGWQLCVHHYLGTERASDMIEPLEQEAIKATKCLERASTYTFGALISKEYVVIRERTADAPLVALTDTYYSTKIQTKHTKVGGTDHIGLGYGACGLPLILHHNTPNNSLAILWAEIEAGMKDGKQQPEMRPLFRRRQRHTEG